MRKREANCSHSVAASRATEKNYRMPCKLERRGAPPERDPGAWVVAPAAHQGRRRARLRAERVLCQTLMDTRGSLFFGSMVPRLIHVAHIPALPMR
jgi:hypothetical protein